MNGMRVEAQNPGPMELWYFCMHLVHFFASESAIIPPAIVIPIFDLRSRA